MVCGFTLTELITCVAIICAVAALALPAFKSAMVKTRSGKCASNLHQLALAFNLFVADNNGRLPQSWVVDYDGPDNNWWYQVSPYTGAKVMTYDWNSIKAQSMQAPYRCPETTGVDKNVPVNAWVSYKMSMAYRKKSSGDTPKVTIGCPRALITDSTKALLLAEGRMTPDFITYATNRVDNGLYYPHDGKVNALFLDGHTEVFTQKQLELRWDECYTNALN